MSPATIQDVADKAKVSITTVSRVMNNDTHKVNPETRQRVLTAAKQLAYHPNALAKGLLRRQTMTIGVMIPDISNPYYAELVRGIQDDADNFGYMVIIENTDRRQDQLLRGLTLLQQQVADGLIIAGGHDITKAGQKELMQFKNRIVLIGRQDLDLPSVRLDNVGGARLAMEYLESLGHGRIAFIAGPPRLATMNDRLLGYQSASRFTEMIETGDLTPESGYLSAKKLLRQNRKPTAILASNDQMAFGAYKAARECCLGIPQDLSIMGFDNIPLGMFLDPAMTTMDIPRYILGSSAMAMIRGRLKDENIEEIQTFRMKLLIRDSTSALLPSGQNKPEILNKL